MLLFMLSLEQSSVFLHPVVLKSLHWTMNTMNVLNTSFFLWLCFMCFCFMLYAGHWVVLLEIRYF